MLEGKLFSVKLNSAFDKAGESCKDAEKSFFSYKLHCKFIILWRKQESLMTNFSCLIWTIRLKENPFCGKKTQNTFLCSISLIHRSRKLSAWPGFADLCRAPSLCSGTKCSCENWDRSPAQHIAVKENGCCHGSVTGFYFWKSILSRSYMFYFAAAQSSKP